MRTPVRSLKTCLVALPILAAAACDPSAEEPKPIDQATAPAEVGRNAGAVVRAAGASTGFLSEDGSFASRLRGGLEGDAAGPAPVVKPFPTDVALGATPPPLPKALMRQLRHSPALRSMKVGRKMSFLTAEEEFDETSKDVEAFLRDRILTEKNVESKEATRIVYLLKADPTCRELPSAANRGGGEPELDEECAEALPKLEVRVIAEAIGDGHRFSVRLGPARHELSQLFVSPSRIGWEADLAESRKAAQFAAKALEDEEESWNGTISGRLRVSLEKTGDKAISFHVGAPEAIEVTSREKGERFSFKTAKNDKIVELTSDGATKAATVAFALGKTDVAAPWDPKAIGADNTDLHVSIAGGRTIVSVEEGKEELEFKTRSEGASFVEVKGKRIFEIDFNKNKGDRRLEGVVKVTADDMPRVELRPRLDLALAFKLKEIAAEIDETPEPYLLDEAYAVTLLPPADGPIVIEGRREAPGFAGGFKMVAGSLAITSNKTSEKVEVAAGKCLTEKDDVASGAHQLLGAFASVDCQ